MRKLTGVLAPVPTFITSNGEIDHASNLSVCEQLSETDLGGLFILGTTGEFAYFSLEERKKYMKFLLSNYSNKKPLVMCVNHWNTDIAVELTELALSSGAKNISALLPLYYPLSENSIKFHYSEIRKTIDEHDSSVPLILYHIPLLPSTVSLTPQFIADLASEGIINGIKNSVFDYAHARSLLDLTDKNFNFLCGTEKLLLESFKKNEILSKFDGGIFTGADIAPNHYAKIFDAAIKSDKEEFYRIWPNIDNLTSMWDDGLEILPSICKYAMKISGFNVNFTTCKPLPDANAKQKKNAKRIIKELKIFWGNNSI